MASFLAIGIAITMFSGLLPSTPCSAAPAESGSQSEYLDLQKHPEFAKQVKIKFQPPMFKYPIQAKIRGVQGTVIVDAYVDATGMVVKAVPMSGPSELAEVVVPYVLKFEFYPLIIESLPKPFIYRFTVPFKLH